MWWALRLGRRCIGWTRYRSLTDDVRAHEDRDVDLERVSELAERRGRHVGPGPFDERNADRGQLSTLGEPLLSQSALSS